MNRGKWLKLCQVGIITMVCILLSGCYWNEQVSYIDGELIVHKDSQYEVVTGSNTVMSEDSTFSNTVMGLVLIGSGVLSIIKPHIIHYITVGIWYKKLEPSDFALAVNRISGVIAVMAGIFCLLMY